MERWHKCAGSFPRATLFTLCSLQQEESKMPSHMRKSWWEEIHPDVWSVPQKRVLATEHVALHTPVLAPLLCGRPNKAIEIKWEPCLQRLYSQSAAAATAHRQQLMTPALRFKVQMYVGEQRCVASRGSRERERVVIGASAPYWTTGPCGSVLLGRMKSVCTSHQKFGHILLISWFFLSFSWLLTL